MKFLTITSLRDTAYMVPPATIRPILERSLVWVNQLKQRGKILEIYSLAGTPRSIFISEYDSAEELVRDFAALPLAPIRTWETYPLADFVEMMKASIERAKGAEQIFPAAPK